MAEIVLFKNKGVALVDDEDFERVMEVSKYWHMRSGYACCCLWVDKKGVHLSMHRVVLGANPKGMVVDHINGNSLDNRRANLRFCTHAENMRNQKTPKNNKTGFKGVFCDKKSGKYRSEITINGARKTIGSFATAKEAAHEYNIAALKHHGEFARLNEI